jgi:hypothetical protein
MGRKSGVSIALGFMVAVAAAIVACGGGSSQPCKMMMTGALVDGAVVFKLDVWGGDVHCMGNTVPMDSPQPQVSQTYNKGTPIRLDIKPGAHTLRITTYADASTTKFPTGSACIEKTLSPGGSICFDVEVTKFVPPCPSTALICGSICCVSSGGTCNNDCTLTCTAPNQDCDNNPINGCESNVPSDPVNCGTCGRKCALAGQAHVVTPMCSGGACASACEAGWSDCDHVMSGADDGCECHTPGCCGGGFCQTPHDNGFGQNYFDCEALSNWSQTLSDEAAAAYGMVHPGTILEMKPGGDLAPTTDPKDANCTVTGATCILTANDCPCWTYLSSGDCRTSAEGHAYKATPASKPPTKADCVPAFNFMPPNVPWT